MDYLKGTWQSKFSEWLGLSMREEVDGSFSGTVTLDVAQEGPPFHVHGGVLASLLDEVMGRAVWATGRRSLAVNLNINYRRPVPLGSTIRITGRIERTEGRKTFASGEIILPDDTVAVEGSGIFVEASIEALEKADYKFNFKLDQDNPDEA